MVSDFVFHEVSDKEREEIKKQAKGILDDFSKQLDKVKDKIGEPLIERDECEREEGAPKVYPEKSSSKISTRGMDCNNIDREIMFENAPNKNEDFILGEKGGWN
jgi:hypothetical protein